MGMFGNADSTFTVIGGSISLMGENSWSCDFSGEKLWLELRFALGCGELMAN